MKRFYLTLLLFAVISLGCGISAATPTVTQSATEQPTKSAPVHSGVVVVWQTPSTAWVVCDGTSGLNVRVRPSMQSTVKTALPDGAEVFRIGELTKDDKEVWQLVIAAGRVTGYVDPAYLCGVVK